MRENPDHGAPTTPEGGHRVVPVDQRHRHQLLPRRWEARDLVPCLFLVAGLVLGVLRGVN